MFYMGKEFNKEENKEYKTLEGGLKAAQKNQMNLYDENGEIVSENVPKVQLTDDVPEGALQKNPDGTVNTYNEAGEKVGTATPEEVQAAMDAIAEDDIEKAAAAAQAEDAAKEEGKEPDGVTEVKGKIKRVFNGKLRVRRSASWDSNAACGVTSFDEKKVVRRHVVDGKPLFETADGYFISGKSDHVEFIAE